MVLVLTLPYDLPEPLYLNIRMDGHFKAAKWGPKTGIATPP